eukprot:XP_014061296.1 PREDICTED: uncharacterized protein LOC106608107 isoform X2 [Salmo salar]
MVSNRGPQFSSWFRKAFCKLIGLSTSLSSGFHPQSNGQSERANQDPEMTLCCLVSTNPTAWSQQLVWVESARNTLPCSATGFLPFECSLGYQPPLFPEQEVGIPSPQMFVCRTWKRARSALLKTTSRYRRQVHRHRIPAPQYCLGQRVWLSTRDLPLRVESRKLSPRFIGPSPTSKIISLFVFCCLVSSVYIPLFMCLGLNLCLTALYLLFIGLPLFPVIDVQPANMVRRLLKVRPLGRGFQYLVDWEGYGPEERCCVPARDILDPDLIAEFQCRHPGQPAFPVLTILPALTLSLPIVLYLAIPPWITDLCLP